MSSVLQYNLHHILSSSQVLRAPFAFRMRQRESQSLKSQCQEVKPNLIGRCDIWMVFLIFFGGGNN